MSDALSLKTNFISKLLACRFGEKPFIFSFFRFAILYVMLICLSGCGTPSADSDDSKERYAAVDRLMLLEDEDQLAEIALDNRDQEAANHASVYVKNQILLEKLAVGSVWGSVRGIAFRNLNSPGRLAQILHSEPAKAIPFIESQTDRAFISEVSKISERGFNGSIDSDNFVWFNCGIVASLKLSLYDPTIQSRLGELKLVVKCVESKQDYMRWGQEGYLGSAGTSTGEKVTVRIDSASSGTLQAGPLVEQTFKTDFPMNYVPLFRGAELSAKSILSELLHRSEFTQNDLQNIAINSKVSDLRACAVFSISDQNLLDKIAHNDPAPQVRLAAVDRLETQKTLYQIAINQHEKLRIRLSASQRVTDVALKKKLAKVFDN
jgi:hypothetical protein